jgi:hypothetical protein
MPWVVEKADPIHFSYVPTKIHIPSKDGDVEVLLDQIQSATPTQERSEASTTEPLVLESNFVDKSINHGPSF